MGGKAGTIIAERYRLERMIGEGGMGSIWLATHTQLGSSVAVKFIDVVGPNTEKEADRFLREARIAARVKHRGVVTVLDFGRCEYGPYMVMELLDGETLGDRIGEGPMEERTLVSIALKLLKGLAAVHSAGIVHRDLKPDNIMFEAEGQSLYPKLVDFGLGKASADSGMQSAATTRDGIVAGTPLYMSPEQARGLTDIDVRTDIYSAGVIMYEALAGRPPTEGDTVGDIIVEKLTADPTPLQELRPGLSPELVALVHKAMERAREDRFESVEDLIEALRACEHAYARNPATTIVGYANRERASEPDGRVSYGSGMGPPRDPNGELVTVPPPAPAEIVSEDPTPMTSASAVPPPAKPASRLAPYLVATGVAMTSAAGWLWLRPVDEAPVHAAGSPAPASARPASDPTPVPPSPAPAAPVVAPVSTTHTVRLKGLPADAAITVDGDPASSPVLQLDNDKLHSIVVQAEGKQAWRTEHRAQKDHTYSVSMVDAPRARKPRARKRPRPQQPAKRAPGGREKAGGFEAELDF